VSNGEKMKKKMKKMKKQKKQHRRWLKMEKKPLSLPN